MLKNLHELWTKWKHATDPFDRNTLRNKAEGAEYSLKLYRENFEEQAGIEEEEERRFQERQRLLELKKTQEQKKALEKPQEKTMEQTRQKPKQMIFAPSLSSSSTSMWPYK